MANGFGVSGQPFVGADVGGFHGHSNAELFLRWMQYGALTPFCRNHSEIGNVDQYAWAWGDAVLDLVRERDRAALPAAALPLRGVHRARRETGAPVQRPLVFDHQYDAAVRDIDDQYLFGPDLLVAPVDEPGMTARQVYLPGGRLVRLAHRRARSPGARFVVAATPMDRIPLYARARRGDPDVAGGAALDRRLPPARDRAARLRPARRRHATSRSCRRTTA